MVKLFYEIWTKIDKIVAITLSTASSRLYPMFVHVYYH